MLENKPLVTLDLDGNNIAFDGNKLRISEKVDHWDGQESRYVERIVAHEIKGKAAEKWNARCQIRKAARVLGQGARNSNAFFPFSKETVALIAAQVTDALPLETAEKYAAQYTGKPKMRK